MSFRSDLEMLCCWGTLSMANGRHDAKPVCGDLGAASIVDMMKSSNGIIFRVLGPLRGEFTGHRRIPLTKASDAGLWCIMCSLICAWINGWVNNREAGDLTRHRAHYDVTVMNQHCTTGQARVCDFHWVIIRLLLIKSAKIYDTFSISSISLSGHIKHSADILASRSNFIPTNVLYIHT